MLSLVTYRGAMYPAPLLSVPEAASPSVVSLFSVVSLLFSASLLSAVLSAFAPSLFEPSELSAFWSFVSVLSSVPVEDTILFISVVPSVLLPAESTSLAPISASVFRGSFKLNVG